MSDTQDKTLRSHLGPIKVRELPGFTVVGDAALLYGDERLEEAAGKFTERHFEVRVEDLGNWLLSDDDWLDLDNLDLELERLPQQLFADNLSDDEAADFLLSLGFDLRCERGLPLRSTKAIALQVEAAARKLAGRLPDPVDIATESFEARIAAEAAAFQATKRAKQR